MIDFSYMHFNYILTFLSLKSLKMCYLNSELPRIFNQEILFFCLPPDLRTPQTDEFTNP